MALTGRTVFFFFIAQLLVFLIFFMYFNNYTRNKGDNATAVRFDAEIVGVIEYNTSVDWKALHELESHEIHVDWNRVPRKPPPSQEEMHDKWIVVTTIAEPTEDVKKLAKIEGWKLVVVGDTKTPDNWNVPGVIYLSPEKQKSLGYNLVKVLPFKTYTRKCIGYLYAIEHGARMIYETDDDNYPTNGKILFHQMGIGDFLVYKAEQGTFINAYAHFGQTSIWPRGYPLEYIANPPHHEFFKCRNVRPLIQQGIVNGDPDVDAIFRLTRKDVGVNLDLKFDQNAPVVLLPPGGYCPYNCQNTLHMYDALWGLILPVSVNMRVTDIWRSYWAQRLLNDIDGYVSFFPPNAYQIRNAHSYLKDFKDEEFMYYETSEMVKFLHNWKSTKFDFFTRVLQLSIDLAKKGFYKPIDAVEVEAWLLDLVSFGYKIPELKPTVNPCREIIEEPKVVKSKEQLSSYLGLDKTMKNIYD